jgi:hypothetical protein
MFEDPQALFSSPFPACVVRWEAASRRNPDTPSLSQKRMMFSISFSTAGEVRFRSGSWR